MTSITVPSRFVHLEDRMERRKIRDEADARTCMAAVKESGLTRAAWCRASGVDGRSLRAWSMNLARRRTTGRRKKKTVTAVAKRVELVELIAAQPMPPTAAPGYTVRVGRLGIEVCDNFDAGTLRRLVAVLAAC
jgi:transposase-like protein